LKDVFETETNKASQLTKQKKALENEVEDLKNQVDMLNEKAANLDRDKKKFEEELEDTKDHDTDRSIICKFSFYY